MSGGYANSAVDFDDSGNFKLPWVDVTGGVVYGLFSVVFHYITTHSQFYPNFPVVCCSRIIYNITYLLQLGCHPVAVVILHVNKT